MSERPPPTALPRCCADASSSPATAAFLAQHLTVIVNTSPCAAHPSTRVLEETCASLALAPGLAACRLLLVFDGFKLRDRLRVKRGFVTPDVAAAYERYVTRCELLAATPGSPLQGAQLLRVGVCMGGQPVAQGIVIADQAVTPEFGLVQTEVVLS